MGADLLGAFHQLFALHNFKYPVGNRTRQRMRGIGEKHEVGPRLLAHFRQLALYRNHPHRDVAAGKSLTPYNNVGYYAPMLDRETFAGAPEPGHNLIGD